MDNALLVSGFDRLGNLLTDRQRFFDGDGALCDAVCKGRPLDEFHHECGGAVAALQTVHVGDARLSRASTSASRWNRTRRSESPASASGNTLMATARFRLVSVAL